jgi:uncharacterized protein YqeY
VSLRDQLEADLRAALRSGDETRKGTLRLLLTAIRNAEIPGQTEEMRRAMEAFEAGSGGATSEVAAIKRQALDDESVRGLIAREIKIRRDSIDQFRAANRPDLLPKQEAELAVLLEYLPPQLTREEIAAAARAVIERVGAKGPADKGKVMPVIMGELRGKAEGSQINAVVTELLGR